jgi:RNA polymerase sigma-70 factor (ECF subfamily)
LIGRISSEGDRDDVLQEILISIHKARHTYDGKRLLMPWVYAIAKFRLSDYLRKHYKNPSKNSVEYTEVQEHLLVDVTNEVSDDESNVVSLLEKLPKKQRIIVTRMKLEGYTAKEVGKELGMNTSAVKVAAHRAYQKLREEFKKLENERP